MANKKGKTRLNITIECVDCRKSESKGVSRYATNKNKNNTTDKLQIKKYCKFERKHTIHKEIK